MDRFYPLCHIKEMDPRQLKRIDNALNRLNAHRPLNPSIVNKLREQFTIDMTYHSNAIEGNQLTLKETYLVLREGMTVKGKNLRDHLEARNHQEALQYLFDLVNSKKRVHFSHSLIRSLHQLVVKDTEQSIAGKYRTTDVAILGSSHRPPPGYRVQSEMDQLIEWMKKQERKLHAIEFAAEAHHQFVHIHPFEDGNGRTGRLLMNLLLMRRGYPITIILKSDRKKYYKSLEMADHDKGEPLTRLIAQAVERSLVTYLKAIEGTRSKKDELIPLSELADGTTYSPKYLNLLVNKGLLQASKFGRNWYSSRTELKAYEASRLRMRKRK
jgi:Fic family protein